jgi:glyceraldehyde-3-phosphate dehydrogenase type II
MNMSRNVHVIGTGTIGAPLTHLLARHQEDLKLDLVTFHKRSPLYTDRSRIVQLIKAGAYLAVDENRYADFKAMKMTPNFSSKEALREADVIIDCTPAGNKNKENIYEKLSPNKGFIAQGSEDGFGKKYVRGINDSALTAEDKYIQVVSCNTHTISSLINTLAYKNGTNTKNLLEGRFVCIRRANDISQDGNFVPSPTISGHDDEIYGTHHAKDAFELYETLDLQPNLFSSSMKVNTQLMHIVNFDLKVKENTSVEELTDLLDTNPFIAKTYKSSANQIFSFGREYGFYGRILNHGVVPHQKLHVRETTNGFKIAGSCFTPQDGNSLLSSAAATLRFLDSENYVNDLQILRQYVFDEI